jgi:hypothetical protein
MHNNCGLMLSLSLDTFSSRLSWSYIYIKSYVIMSERNLNIQHSKTFLYMGRIQRKSYGSGHLFLRVLHVFLTLKASYGHPFLQVLHVFFIALL